MYIVHGLPCILYKAFTVYCTRCAICVVQGVLYISTIIIKVNTEVFYIPNLIYSNQIDFLNYRNALTSPIPKGLFHDLFVFCVFYTADSV